MVHPKSHGMLSEGRKNSSKITFWKLIFETWVGVRKIHYQSCTKVPERVEEKFLAGFYNFGSVFFPEG
jgi:hypothetical protein